MKKEQKFDMYYKLWEHHSNLLWNKIQNIFVIMAAFYTAWFLLFDIMINDTVGKDCLYLISPGLIPRSSAAQTNF